MIARDTRYIQVFNVLALLAMIITTVVVLPESPKWLQSQERYEEARDSLEQVATFNN